MKKIEKWGQIDGKPVNLFEVDSSKGLSMSVTNFGARMTSLKIPQKNGDPVDVLLGFDNFKQYRKDETFLGAIVGRFANRIKGGHFNLNEKNFQLDQNEGENHLHGGYKGFDKRLWHGELIDTDRGPGVDLSYESADGEGGYPGNLKVKVQYILSRKNKLIINIRAKTDKTTIVNLANHNYYNLTVDAGNISDYQLKIAGDSFLPITEDSIPTGEIRHVESTPFDFRKPTRIGQSIDKDDPQINNGDGYNHNFVLDHNPVCVGFAAEVQSPASGISFELFTDQPGLQFYSGNLIPKNLSGKKGEEYGPRQGLCLEAQGFPDAPNQKNFPSAVLNPNEKYNTVTIVDFQTS